MSNSIAPGSSADVNVKVTALTTNQNVPVTYKTIILKKNLVNGVNTLTQEMINTTNIIYVIKYDFVLADNISVASNCVLHFDGGSIQGSNYLTLNGCKITGVPKLFSALRQVSGQVYFSWFDDGNGDSAVLERILNTRLPENGGRTEGVKLVIDKALRITETIKIYKNIHITGLSKEQVSWIYPYSNFIGDYVIDIEGDGLIGDWAFRSTLENLYIHTLAYTPAEGEDLKAIIHIHQAYGIELNQLRVANSATNNTAIGLDISYINGININSFVYYGNEVADTVGVKFGSGLSLVTCNYLSSEACTTALLLTGNGISSIRGFYTERSSLGIKCELTEGGQCSIVGGFIPLAGPYTIGVDVQTAEGAYLTLEGIGIATYEGKSRNGVYLRGDYQNNVTLIGIRDDVVKSLMYTRLDANSSKKFQNIITYSGTKEIEHLKKYILGQIKTHTTTNQAGKGGIIRIYVRYILSPDTYYTVYKEFYFFLHIGYGYKSMSITERKIKSSLTYNYNTKFNVKLAWTNDNLYNSADIVLETSVTGALQSGKAQINYNVEIIPDSPNLLGYMPNENADGETLESITIETPLLKGGTTAQRPTAVEIGYNYYDTTLSKAIWYDGNSTTGWADATGTPV